MSVSYSYFGLSGLRFSRSLRVARINETLVAVQRVGATSVRHKADANISLVSCSQLDSSLRALLTPDSSSGPKVGVSSHTRSQLGRIM
jgi:hypothetical protein